MCGNARLMDDHPLIAKSLSFSRKKLASVSFVFGGEAYLT